MRTLGRTGLKVSEQCLGTMMFGSFGNQDREECQGIVHRALDAGVNFVDTADMYSAGVSEEFVGEALRGRRDDVVLATKFHNPMGDDPNRRGNSRRWIMQAVEDSLRRLQTDWIDLYQVHRPDPDTDIEETLGALTDLVQQGKVRYVGSSTFPAEAIVEAQWASDRRGLARFVCEQPPYSIFVRGIETAVLPTCQKYGIGVIVWSPLGGGWLTGKYRSGKPVPAGSRGSTPSPYFDATDERKLAAVEELLKVAADAGLSLTHLALAWVLRHPAVTSAIIGPKTLPQLEDQLAAADVVLDDDILDRIDRIVAPGVTVDSRDNGWVSPALTDPGSRRLALRRPG